MPDATRIIHLAEALAVAQRVVDEPAMARVSEDERVALAVAVLAQHDMIVAAGLAYPQAASGADAP